VRNRAGRRGVRANPVITLTLTALEAPQVNRWGKMALSTMKGRSPQSKDPGPIGDNGLRKDYTQVSMRVIVVALGEFDEYARFFSYSPRIMTWRQHHDVPRAELLLRTVVHHHL
jgi:hypothetical protein